MAQSYKQIQRQIEALQRRAESLRREEMAGVVARIKVAIDHYGITAEQLGLAQSGAQAPKPMTRRTGAAPVAKYQDGQGNSWSGRGPRPHWLRNALGSGRSLDEFASQPSASSGIPRVGKAAGKRKSKVRFRDGEGREWSGMGPRPRWLKDALAAGQTLEQLAA